MGGNREQQERLASDAFAVVRRAVDLDAALTTAADLYARRDELLALYEQGLELLGASLEHADEDSAASRALAQKVLRNYRTVSERADELRKLQKPYIDPFSPLWRPEMDNPDPSPVPTPTPAPASPSVTPNPNPSPSPSPSPFPPAPQQQKRPLLTGSGGFVLPPAQPPVPRATRPVAAAVPPQTPQQRQQAVLAAHMQRQQALGQLVDEVTDAQNAYKRARTPEERRVAYERLRNAMARKMRTPGAGTAAPRAAPRDTRPPPPTVASVPSFLDALDHPQPAPQPQQQHQQPRQTPMYSPFGSSQPQPQPQPQRQQQQPVQQQQQPQPQQQKPDDKRREELLRGVDKKLQQAILNDVVEHGPGVRWEDIGGLEDVKRALYEAVIFPSLRPDLFMGIRAPPRGLLLFGPPGNGKTMIAKAVAQESRTTFFNISASSLTSKWVGEGEKMVRALFALARYLQPSVVFIDEVDSLLTERSSTEHDAMRRLKTEFLVQFDGVGTDAAERVFILGATNRPQDLDEAARRRFARCIYVRLPDAPTRRAIIAKLLRGNATSITPAELDDLARRTHNYSGADLTRLCQEAALLPLRELSVTSIATVAADAVRPIAAADIVAAMKTIRPTVSEESLAAFERWNTLHGSVSSSASSS